MMLQLMFGPRCSTNAHVESFPEVPEDQLDNNGACTHIEIQLARKIEITKTIQTIFTKKRLFNKLNDGLTIILPDALTWKHETI